MIARPTTAAPAPAAASARTSPGDRTPPAARTSSPEAATERTKPRGRGRRACRPGRSPSAEDARPTPAARQSLDRPLGWSRPDSAVQPALCTIPSADIERDDRQASRRRAAAHGAGSGKAAVPSTIRSAPAAIRERASSSERMPPEAWSGGGADRGRPRHARGSGRARPERAPSRSTTWIRLAPAAANRVASAIGSPASSTIRS